MTDRELLELAAKAAEGAPKNCTLSLSEWIDISEWNPLTDDGDALRLAVKLRIGVQCHQERGDYVLADDAAYLSGQKATPTPPPAALSCALQQRLGGRCDTR